ncbi:integral membrane protein (TIGR01906 family) [Peptoniphilus ivorii]|uniref:TIGR01906 family membrane protein n=1 Tax=Aedoeadaptatus ivorii TaxID=54006 RepID=UPI002780797C|nr:TIGR01906 family membrane protein [Peptoniphilus ivorii]MDQ0508947.1 integral membrane protein (TIGR01906 family) [Peptoniphilus ivorii]
MKKFLSLLVAGLCIFLCFSLATYIQSQDADYYAAQMRKNRIDCVTGLSFTRLDEISDGLRAYLRTGEEKQIAPYFSAEEVVHMKDVYGLFQWMARLSAAGVCIVVWGAYRLKKRYGIRGSMRAVGRAAWIWIAVFALLAAAIAVNFHRAWFLFHRLVFSNELWLMDPQTDLMIQMLPENFFSGMVLRIGAVMIVAMALLSAMGFVKGTDNGIE